MILQKFCHLLIILSQSHLLHRAEHPALATVIGIDALESDLQVCCVRLCVVQHMTSTYLSEIVIIGKAAC